MISFAKVHMILNNPHLSFYFRPLHSKQGAHNWTLVPRYETFGRSFHYETIHEQHKSDIPPHFQLNKLKLNSKIYGLYTTEKGRRHRAAQEPPAAVQPRRQHMICRSLTKRRSVACEFLMLKLVSSSMSTVPM